MEQETGVSRRAPFKSLSAHFSLKWPSERLVGFLLLDSILKFALRNRAVFYPIEVLSKRTWAIRVSGIHLGERLIGNSVTKTLDIGKI
jgi:hypothetical protein